MSRLKRFGNVWLNWQTEKSKAMKKTKKLSMKEPSKPEWGYIPLKNVPNEFKEYFITEWTSDHAHQSWRTYQSIMDDFGISGDSIDPDDWHCLFHQVRVQPAKNVVSKKDIADKFGVQIEDLIIID